MNGARARVPPQHHVEAINEAIVQLLNAVREATADAAEEGQPVWLVSWNYLRYVLMVMATLARTASANEMEIITQILKEDEA